MKIEIQNLTTLRVSERFVKKIIHTILRLEGERDNISIGIAFLSRKKMQALGNFYKKNHPSDVLAFARGKDFLVPREFGKYLGEVAVCPSCVREQAARSKIAFNWALAHALIHGALHLLGWEHEGSRKALEKMHAREEEIWQAILSQA